MSADPRLHYETPLLATPFHARTSLHNRMNHWGPWAGYTTSLVYEDEAMEYSAIRNAASLYDLSPMTKYRIAGPDAAAFLDRLAVRNAGRLPVGAVHYTLWCDDDGKVLDDGTLFRLAADEFRLCCQERHLPWLRRRHRRCDSRHRRAVAPGPDQLCGAAPGGFRGG
jgi:aminomethyltransferase